MHGCTALASGPNGEDDREGRVLNQIGPGGEQTEDHGKAGDAREALGPCCGELTGGEGAACAEE